MIQVGRTAASMDEVDEVLPALSREARLGRKA